MSYNDAVSLISRGRANPSDYQVMMPSNVLGNAVAADFHDYISFFTRAITLPGTAHSAMSLRGHENVGISRNVITGRTFGSPVVMTFSERTDLVVYGTLKGWMNDAVLNSEQSGNRNLRVQYYDTTKCDIDILKLEPMRDNNRVKTDDKLVTSRNHRVTGKWNLINCVPLSIEQVTLSMESADSLLDWTLSVAYESFKFERIDQSYDDYIGSVKEQKPFTTLGGVTKTMSGLLQ